MSHAVPGAYNVANMTDDQINALNILSDPKQLSALATARNVDENVLREELTKTVAPDPLPFCDLTHEEQDALYASGKAADIVRAELAAYRLLRNPPVRAATNGDSNIK